LLKKHSRAHPDCGGQANIPIVKTAIGYQRSKTSRHLYPIFKASPRLLGFHNKHLRDQFNQGLKMLKREHGIFK